LFANLNNFHDREADTLAVTFRWAVAYGSPVLLKGEWDDHKARTTGNRDGTRLPRTDPQRGVLYGLRCGMTTRTLFRGEDVRARTICRYLPADRHRCSATPGRFAGKAPLNANELP
jgi:hypothetical protein